ncbi:MAG TPA: hypothetical protein VKY57_16115 [Chitinispirillaceae bacterium]|nr:hypothetical protein [Chitinispirillaceae bacterium]
MFPIFIIFAILYLTVAIVVNYWQTITRCGFSSETPVLYIRSPMVYSFVSYFLFILSLLLGFLQNQFPFWITTLILFIFFMLVGIVSRGLGLSKYRSIIKELIENSNDDKEKAELQEQLNLPDIEILKRSRR